jgi:DNA recombination protein RmuC
MEIALLITGLLVGALASWFVARTRGAAEAAGLRLQLEHERSAGDEKVAALTEAREQLSTQLKAMCSEALQGNSRQFMELAKSQFEQLQQSAQHDLASRQQAVEHLVKPIKESLEKVGTEVKTLEASRRQDYGRLTEQVRSLAETNDRLRSETGNLVTALRAPNVRGRWGEMQLRRTVEAAGMLDYCDFTEQETGGEDGRRLRPDLIVKLPGGRNVVVDAKTPLQALLDGLDDSLDDAARVAKMQDFKRHIRDHVAKLTAKGYWQQFSPTPDFVVMFLPGESFYRAAIEQDPELLELHANARVIIASPTTLITLLRAIAVGWREERVAESARAVSELGRELYERLATMVDHFGTVGKRLDGAVQAYNQTVGSLERRVLVSARRFPEHGIGTDKQIAELLPVDKSTQQPQTIELPTRTADAA